MNIVNACRDKNLFRPYLIGHGHGHAQGGESGTASWGRWLTALRVLYGLPTLPADAGLVTQCTGRTRDGLPADGFDAALFLTGRRSGKSRIAAVAAAYEAALAGHEARLAPGERGVVAVCAPSKPQARIVRDYCRAAFDTPLLRAELVRETRGGFELKTGIAIEIMAGDWRTVRGYTLVAAVVDEAAFFGLDSESKVKSDTELMRALRPALATVGGKLIAISTPYARKGWTWQTYKHHHGNEEGSTLVWNCPSRTMNPTLPESVVNAALAEDRQAARSEYLGEFRDDVAEFLPRSLIDGLAVPGRKELLPRPHLRYTAFADLSGGRGDDAALAVAHRDGDRVVIDCLKRYRPPFSPQRVVVEMSEVLRRYGLRTVTGDNYAAEFAAQAFRSNGIRYTRCPVPKSGLYLELLPRLCSGGVELPDDPSLLAQLAGLERRTRSGGKDVVDHPPGGHDDLANVAAGVAVAAATPRRVVGALPAAGRGRGAAPPPEGSLQAAVLHRRPVTVHATPMI